MSTAGAQEVDTKFNWADYSRMHFAKALGTVALTLGMGFIVSACTGKPPELPSNVTDVNARHDHEGTEASLKLDSTKLVACLETSKAIPMGEAHKCQLQDGDYTVNLNGGATVITIHTSKQFTIDHQGFFSNDCLYPMLFKAAHSKDLEPGGC